MQRRFWGRKIAGFIVLAALGIAAFGYIVMTLWNSILVTVLSVHAITFSQALGILVLSKILFGGFGGGSRWKGRNGWGEKMKAKWANMPPEEQEKFKAEWRNKCSRWGANKQPNNAE